MSDLIIKSSHIEKTIREHPESKKYFETLFPDYFEERDKDDAIFCDPGDIILRYNSNDLTYPYTVLSVIEDTPIGHFSIKNMNSGHSWKNRIKLKDRNHVTRGEFKELSGALELDRFVPRYHLYVTREGIKFKNL